MRTQQVIRRSLIVFSRGPHPRCHRSARRRRGWGSRHAAGTRAGRHCYHGLGNHTQHHVASAGRAVYYRWQRDCRSWRDADHRARDGGGHGTPPVVWRLTLDSRYAAGTRDSKRANHVHHRCTSAPTWLLGRSVFRWETRQRQQNGPHHDPVWGSVHDVAGMVYIGDGASPAITNSSILNSSSGGIVVSSTSTPTIRGCFFRGLRGYAITIPAADRANVGGNTFAPGQLGIETSS